MPKRSKKNKRNLFLIFGLGFLAVIVIVLLYLTFVIHVFSKVAICNNRFPIEVNGEVLKLPICTNKNINSADEKINELVVIIHGDGRNATDNEVHIEKAAKIAGTNQTLIIAPQFLIADDLGATEKQNILYWSFLGWKQGDESLTWPYGRNWSMSSYEVTDKIINHVLNSGLFPNISKVVIVGHSAGGQFVNRYAAGNVQQQNSPNKISFKYIIASPSSYLYFDNLRKTSDSNNEFEDPSQKTKQKCSTYNDYKYGLNKLNPYMQKVGSVQIVEQYKSREVVYLLGGADKSRWDSSVDKSCQADLQGSNRLERGQVYFNYIGQVLGKTVYKNHRQIVISDVNHDARELLVAPEGVNELF